MELNPNHPVVAETRDHWHKIVAIMMSTYGLSEFEVTIDAVARLGDGTQGVVMDCRNDKMVVRLVTMEEGERLAREAGGLAM
jgi:hypothetical protein